MKYFNGFSLKGEDELFYDYIDNNDFTVAGFSYGAQRAMEFVYNSDKRVDKLILLSPAFFQTQKKSFIRTQLRYFDNNAKEYTKQFLLNTAYPSSFDLSTYLDIGTKEELENLLNYKWDIEKLEEINNRGITVEVYLGSEDKIILSSEAFEFFSNLSIVYYIKGVGHCLK
ncbi:FIG00387961: hypothetical protein [hydrothermal vent metagenome]|uniref:AB hydrolase-1 domain-containing protein n=1 Tax=hydrothermal vent metagenome TaxID=652676 RepID=A0A1W1BAU2_9ZZZZ